MESAVSAAVSTYVGRDKGNIKEIDLQLDSDGHVGISLDLETLDAALNYLTAKEAALDAKLLDLRETSAKAAAAELPELRARSAALVATGRELDALAADLAASSSAAAASSATLRGVHEERERVLQAAHMVDELLGLEECAGEVDAALGRGDYSAAVARVAPLARAIAATETESEATEQPPTIGRDGSREGARAAEVVESMRKRVSSELKSVSASGSDVGAVCSLAKLMGPLGRAHDGREALTAFALRQLDEAAAIDELNASNQPLPALVSAALGRLLQRCAALLESADGALDEEMGGSASREELAQCVRERCVALGAKLGARFNQSSGLKSLVDDGTKRMQRANAAVQGEKLSEVIDGDGERAAQACEGAMDAMCALLRGVTQWDAYIRGKAGGGGDGSDSNELTLRHSQPFSEMARATVTLNHFWAYASVGRAVRTQAERAASETADENESDSQGGENEMVDSSFYVLQTALRRAAHTCDGGIATASVKHACDLLKKLVLGQLNGQLKQSLGAKLAGAALIGATAAVREAAEGIAQSSNLSSGMSASLAERAGLRLETAGATRQLGLLRTLSALDLCVSYTPRLWQAATEDFSRSLPPGPPITGALKQLRDAESVIQAFEAGLDNGLRQLSSALLPRLRPRLDTFGNASYTLQTEAAFAAADGDSFVNGLMVELEHAMRPLSPPTLAEGARERLLLLLIQSCCERLESLLVAKRFDALGAMHLDREVRALAKRLGELSTRSVREKMARLTQMSTLLNLETEVEAVGLWRAEGYEWRLSALEAKQCLALRVDFRSDVINGLALS